MRAETPIDLAFLDHAVFAEGAPANFKGVIPTCQVSPLVKYVEQTGARRFFRHCRISEIGERPAYLPIGMFGSPHHWIARAGQPHSFAAKATDLPAMLERCPRLKLLIDYSWEAGLHKDFLQEFDAFVASMQVDTRRVVLLVSNRGLEARYHADGLVADHRCRFVPDVFGRGIQAAAVVRAARHCSLHLGGGIQRAQQTTS